MDVTTIRLPLPTEHTWSTDNEQFTTQVYPNTTTSINCKCSNMYLTDI